jgi:hypothetical protein
MRSSAIGRASKYLGPKFFIFAQKKMEQKRS